MTLARPFSIFWRFQVEGKLGHHLHSHRGQFRLSCWDALLWKANSWICKYSIMLSRIDVSIASVFISQQDTSIWWNIRILSRCCRIFANSFHRMFHIFFSESQEKQKIGGTQWVVFFLLFLISSSSSYSYHVKKGRLEKKSRTHVKKENGRKRKRKIGM